MIFDAHIHLEKYSDDEIESMVRDPRIAGLIAVSVDLSSSRRTLAWKRRFPEKVLAACGFHPEQERADVSALEDFIRAHAGEIDAIGEVGLPYYTRREAMRRGEAWDEEPFLEILNRLLRLAAMLNKPVILHGVREDVNVICDLLEQHRIRRAHFHWLKADDRTLERLAAMGCFASFTPDILYEEETRRVAQAYPLELLMAESDGPWEFEGPFAGRRTHPAMIRESVRFLAELRGMDERKLSAVLAENAQKFIAKLDDKLDSQPEGYQGSSLCDRVEERV